ncbi:hypothetical protein HDU92_002901 [Lobulomyces angularis]|nr:hypothetical protein HDU92_002901 [Lobulomyces angularis]
MHSFCDETFVKTNATAFCLKGRPYMICGANFWSAMNLGMKNEFGGNRDRLERELIFMKKIGLNNLRIMASSEGPDGEPFRIKPSLIPNVETYNENVFEGLDYALDAFSRHGFTAVMVLNNFWHWSGGFCQYVSWAEKSRIPYPDSPLDWPALTLYGEKFYSNKKCQKWFKSHILTLMNRRNTVNGKIYKNDPTIFSWEHANEPQNPPASWIEDIASFIKSISSNHLVTVGLEGKEMDKEIFLKQHISSFVDYTTGHCWVENWGIYDGMDPSTENLNNAINFAKNFANNLGKWSKEDLKKPFVMEEFGMARDGWTQISRYDYRATVLNRNLYFKSLFETIVNLAEDKAATGWCFWAFAGEGRPNKEDDLIGDPPHEERGWYSVYDADTNSWDIIKDLCSKLKEVAHS